MDKALFLDRFDATQPTPESFHLNIVKYAEIANQISIQNDDDCRLSIRYIQLNVTALKSTIIRHIDEWQKLHMDLFAKRSFKKMDLIYQHMEIMSKQLDVHPTNRSEMLETLKLHENIAQTEIPAQEQRFADVRNHFRIMGEPRKLLGVGDIFADIVSFADIHNISVPVEYQKMLKGLDGEWEAFLDKLKEVAETLQTSRDQFA